MKRHSRWYWILLGKSYEERYTFDTACVMDDFGNAVEITYSVTRISLREGDA